MNYVVTGATGPFGRHVIETLLARGVAAADVVAVGRSVDKISDLAERGVQVRAASYDDPEALRTALEGAGTVLLVSGSEVGQRVQQHQNVIDAAVAVGAGRIVYTSLVNAREAGLQLAAEHVATEQALAGSGLAHTVLRNGWYLENYTDQIGNYVANGAVLGSAGEGRISAATRADLAEAAATVLLDESHTGKVYELGMDDAFTLAELAEAVSVASGTAVTYRDLPGEEFQQALVGAGLPESFATVLADTDRGIRDGALHTDTGDLARLLGRPATSMPEAVRAALVAS
ncbi:SDR family oxidoreductase [Ornithinicoccus hortensis]|uniref:NAD(P)H dehydrogenase (Quinone) n=1 Tax=Ornithinicoccus hortensis TaxID=82346 RepID=A0A542YT55_9MICO|nr:SDR family oxidoreductase [Ornithinicoccus hortensis]TQL51241.1 NAD(P)H dehydrogenase (quinone) [Ornithinicoccus hortensis]